MNTIVLTGGGTAGHIMPALALIPELKKTFERICYIGSVGGMEESIVKARNIPYYAVSTAKLRRKFTLRNLQIPLDVARGYRQAKQLLAELKPAVVFSKGGYVAVPVVFAASALKIPVVTHESDFTPGLANRLIAPKAERVLTAFPETAKRFSNGEYTGVKLIAVSIDQAQNINKVKPLVDSNGWEYDVLLDPNSDFKRALGIQMIPYVIIVDGKGNIVYKHNGYTDGAEKELIEKVRELVK